jgi:hypothetical protein
VFSEKQEVVTKIDLKRAFELYEMLERK